MARNSSTCQTMAKGMLMFTGLCYLISAGGLTYIGIWVFSTYDHFDEIADASLTLLPASIILGISVFMCIIGILACIAAFKNNKLLLSVFFCLILIVFVGEILTASLGYVYRKKVESVLEEDLLDAVNNYNVTVYREQIDYMQHEFGCCGIRNASDWEESTFWKINHTKTVPMSCCKPLKVNQTCNPVLASDQIFNEGCLSELNSEFSSNLVYIATTAVFLAVIQFLALISACILVCRTRDEMDYQTLTEVVGSGLRV